MDTWKKRRALGWDLPFDWENTPLEKYADERIYDVSWGWDAESEEATNPWLIWDPPESSSTDDSPEETRLVDALKREGLFPQWEPFRSSTGFEGEFRPVHYFGRWRDQREQLESVIEEFTEQFDDVDPGHSVPVHLVDRFRSIRDETRARLQHHGDKLNERVMEPLRKVLIPCAVEAARATGGVEPLKDLDEEAREKRSEVATDLEHLWSAGIGGGMPFETMKENGWFENHLKHVPEPVAEGTKAAFHVYIETNQDRGTGTRDDILERARPVYFKWRAARQMLGSALYDWPLSEAVERMEMSKRGRKKNIEKPEEVLKTLNVVCQWLDTPSPTVFRGEGGLVNFASEKFPHLTEDGLKDRIPSIFRQLAQNYPDLPTPDFATGMNGSDYVENEEEIRALRDEYKARFVEK